MLVGMGVATAMQVAAQQADDRPPPRDENRTGQTEAITDAQKAQVKAILSKYNASTLTADQAKAIHEAFRQAGIRGGPAVGDTIKASGFDPDKLRDLAPPPGQGPEGAKTRSTSVQGQSETKLERGENDDQRPAQGGNEPSDRSSNNAGPATSERGQGKYSLNQAVSDRAQLSTIAFSGLAFLTGDFGGATFMPPGKVCDYFGFQYMRDIDAAGKGHNPVFLSRVAANVMHILNDGQRKLFEDLASEQAVQFEQLALKRMPLIKAFHRERDGAIPQGAT